MVSCIKRSMIYIINNFMTNDHIISYEDFVTQFGNTPETQLVYNVVYNALLKVYENLINSYQKIISNEDFEHRFLFKDNEVGKTSRRIYF